MTAPRPTFRRALRRDPRALESIATLAAMASELGGPLAQAAALLDQELAEVTGPARRKFERSEAVAAALRTYWGQDTPMTSRARILSRDLESARRWRRSRPTQYEAALQDLVALFDQPPSARTLLRLAAGASD